MRMQKVKLALLEQNTGQIPGLPTNPRTWTQSDIDRLAKSLQETPELFEARPIIAVAFQGKYVILGGNLRYDACLKNGDVEVPCFVFPEGTPIEKLKEVVLKDNGSFGAWDFDALANEWDDLPLTDWGVPAWEAKQPQPGDYGENFSLPNGNKPSSNQITFYFAAEQKEFIENALEEAEEGEDNYGNESKNGNKLYQIVKEWVESRT